MKKTEDQIAELMKSSGVVGRGKNNPGHGGSSGRSFDTAEQGCDSNARSRNISKDF